MTEEERLNNEIKIRIKQIEQLENDIIEYQRDRARLKTKIKTLKRNSKRDKAKLRNRINKAIECIKICGINIDTPDEDIVIRKVLKNILAILGDKENE